MNKRLLVAFLLFVYTLLLRTWGISSFFWMLGDQTRDWSIALGPWRDLPLSGVPSSAGGTTLGPVYYWVLWAIRHVIGPFTGNLPHAGGIGLCVIQSAADAFLLVAVWKRFGSLWLALGLSLLLASQPHDLGLTAAMSNPPLAVALVKVAIALAIMRPAPASPWWTAAATAAAWLAVQAHSTAIFVAVPLIASFPLSEAVTHKWARAVGHLRASIDVILLLELPLLMSVLNGPPHAVGPGNVFDSVGYTIHHLSTIHLATTFNVVAGACSFLLLRPWAPNPLWITTAILICGAATAYRCRRDVILLSITVAPFLAMVAGFALYQQPFDPYYAMPIVPGVPTPCTFIAIRTTRPWCAGLEAFGT